MSALVHRNDRSRPNEFEWLEFSDQAEISPASIWASEDEDEITVQSKRVAVSDLEQVTAVRVDEASASEATWRVPILDESTVLPGEASFATVVLNQPIEPTTVKRREHITANTVEGTTVSKAGPRARILDESAVLSGEASFATVVLNQPIEPTTIKSREHLTANTVEGATLSKAGPRARILDESAVLSGEASFATAMLNQRTNARTYSPLAEFLLKYNWNWRRLNFAMLLLASISTVIMLIILTITQRGVFSSHSAANTAAESLPRPTEPAAAQIELTTPKSSESATIPNALKEESAPAAPSPVAKVEGALEGQKKFSNNNSEPSQSLAAADAKVNSARKVLRQDTKSAASKAAFADESSKRRPTAPQRQVTVNDTSKSATLPERVHVDHSRSEILVSRGEASSSRNEVGQSKTEPKSAPATGGGERPRRVTPQP